MSSLLWMLKFLPGWFWDALFFVSIAAILASYFLKMIPYVSLYRIPIRVASILTLLLSVFFQGYYYNEELYETEKARIEKLKEEAETKAKNLSAELADAQAKLREEIAKRGDSATSTVDTALNFNKTAAERRREAELKAGFNKMSAQQKAEFERQFADSEAKFQQEKDKLKKEYDAMSAQQKADFDRKLKEAEEMIKKECKFPELMTDELNKLTQRPGKEVKK